MRSNISLLHALNAGCRRIDWYDPCLGPWSHFLPGFVLLLLKLAELCQVTSADEITGGTAIGGELRFGAYFLVFGDIVFSVLDLRFQISRGIWLHGMMDSYILSPFRPH